MLLGVHDRDAAGVARPRPIMPAAARTDSVSELGLLARGALQGGAVGSVVATFDRSFYAVLGGKWICVGAAEIGSGPLHVLCRRYLPRRLAAGDLVTVVGSTLCIEGAPFARLQGAPVWTPEPVPQCTMDSLSTGLRIVDQTWRGDLIAEGLAAAGCAGHSVSRSHLLQAATPGVLALQRIIRGEPGEVSAGDALGVADLIGLGPGLTPSGDDLIGGALIALAALGRADRRDVLWKTCCRFLDRTNELSRIHLQTAALGYGAAALHAVLHATLSGSAAQLYPALAALAAIGHTSGRDAFAGALIVLRMLRGVSSPETAGGTLRGSF
jgi:hypothetical protein